MLRWRPIEVPESEAADLAAERGNRLEVYWIEFNTNIEAERDSLLSFLIRPLESLVGEGEYAVDGLTIDCVDESWRIVTTIHNHHRGLNPRLTRFMATVSDEEETVYLDVHKQPG
jgi:hypothetical protein